MGRSYLLVDDNAELAENLAEILCDRGDQVEVAPDGVRALELVRATRFDAVLTDMRMPLMGGAELVHRIRRVDPGLPALVTTAYTDDEDLRTARQEGLLGVLAKPIPVARTLELLGAARRDGIVVLLEDDAALSDNLCELLRARGFTALTAASVLETERLGQVRPFGAVVDLRVPGGPDGEAMSRLAVKFPGLPMVVVTGTTASAPVPPQEVFHKPFATEALLASLERLYASRMGLS